MAYSSYPFPPSTPVFPHASVVHKYLRSYAHHFDLTPHIRLNTSVVAIDRDPTNWNVRLSTGETWAFDLVLVCNGHYRVPRYPDTPGIAAWLNAGKASHSAWYRHPHNLGDTVLVLGAGPSGQDISSEMRTVAKTVIHSMTGATPEDIGNLKRRGRVTEFGENGQVSFEDGSTESGIDYAILATGFELSFPFLPDTIIHSSVPPLVPPLPRELYNSTYGVFPLAKHILPLQTGFPLTSLAFIGLIVKAVPFPLVEAQARAVLHAFAYPEALDRTQEAVDIITRHEILRGELGNDPLLIAKSWHRFTGHEQFEYRDHLYDFAGPGTSEKGGPLPAKVADWEKEMYDQKELLRKVWVDLVKSGEADEWVKGVGENGIDDWIDLTRKMLKKAEEGGVTVEETDKSKL